jgi:hypothetical protein
VQIVEAERYEAGRFGPRSTGVNRSILLSGTLYREGRDRLPLAVVVDFEVVLRESAYGAVLAVADHDWDFHDTHLGT